MAIFKSDAVTNKDRKPSASPRSAREEYVATSKTSVTSALAVNDLCHLAILPPNCIPSGIEVPVTDLDTNGTPTISFSVGILNTAGNDLVAGSLLINTSIVARTGGVARNDDNGAIYEPATWLAQANCPGLQSEKIVALKVVAAAATPAAGTIYSTLRYRAAESGV